MPAQDQVPAQPPIPAQPAQQQLQINVPQLGMDAVEGFAKVWDYNGIKLVLDKHTLTFARDFANIVLKNYVTDLALKAYKAVQAQKAQGTGQAPATQPPQPPQNQAQVPQTSLIVTTD